MFVLIRKEISFILIIYLNIFYNHFQRWFGMVLL
jgi:hypothetical protein